MIVITGGNDTGGGAAGDGNDSIATAQPLDVDATSGLQSIQSDLDPPDTDVDYWSFTGTAGPIQVLTDAKPDNDPFADGYPDLVVTIFDSAGNQIAQNDDPFPQFTQDPELFTILPSDGTYYIEVEEFCNFDGSCTSDYINGLSSFAYALNIIPIDPSQNSVMDEATEPNDTVDTATVMEYEPDTTNGGYFLSIGYGDLSTGDTDGIHFTIPADVPVDPGSRAMARFVLPPPGQDGNGSSINPGIVEVTDIATATVIARLDLGTEDNSVQDRRYLEFPVTPGSEYLLTIDDGPATSGGDPFYFYLHSVFSGNPLETGEPTNDLPATPETLTQAAGVESFFVQGNLTVGDVDYFKVASIDNVVSVSCGSASNGSGVTGLKVTAFKSDGITMLAAGSSVTEGPDEGSDALLQGLDATVDSQIVVKVEKTGQDATNTGDYYECGIHFAPM